MGAASLFFRKLLDMDNNDWKDSRCMEVSLTLQSEAELASFEDLMKCIYGAPLRVATPAAVGALLFMADRFFIKGVVDAIATTLEATPMDAPMINALFDLPEIGGTADSTERLVALRRQQIIHLFRNLNDTNVRTEVYKLRSEALEVLLADETLQVTSENVVWRVVAYWLHENPDTPSVVRRRLWSLVRFSWLSDLFLSDVAAVADLTDVPPMAIPAAMRMCMRSIDEDSDEWALLAAAAGARRVPTPASVVMEMVVPLDMARNANIESESAVLDGYVVNTLVQVSSDGDIGVFVGVQWDNLFRLNEERGWFRFDSLVIEMQRRTGEWTRIIAFTPFVKFSTIRANSGKRNVIKADEAADVNFVGRHADGAARIRVTLSA
jgi:hypothetical protein